MTDNRRVGWTEWDDDEEWWNSQSSSRVEVEDPFSEPATVQHPGPADAVSRRAVVHTDRAHSSRTLSTRVWLGIAVVVVLVASVWVGLLIGKATRADTQPQEANPTVGFSPQLGSEVSDDFSQLPPAVVDPS